MNWKILPGIGKATADLLLKEFKSVKNIRKKDRRRWKDWSGNQKLRSLLNIFNKLKEVSVKIKLQKKWGQDRNPAPFLKSNIL